MCVTQAGAFVILLPEPISCAEPPFPCKLVRQSYACFAVIPAIFNSLIGRVALQTAAPLPCLFFVARFDQQVGTLERSQKLGDPFRIDIDRRVHHDSVGQIPLKYAALEIVTWSNLKNPITVFLMHRTNGTNSKRDDRFFNAVYACDQAVLDWLRQPFRFTAIH